MNGNTLALLSLKCAKNTFDLSSGLTEFSIRDQIVRAAIFSEQLVSSGEAAGEPVLVVGGGIGGVTTAVNLAMLGARVTLVETEPVLFSVQRDNTTRYVGPFMYEWPASYFKSQDYPSEIFTIPQTPALSPQNLYIPSWTSAEPLLAGDLIRQIDDWLKPFITGTEEMAGTLTIFTNVPKNIIKTMVKTFVANGSATLATTGIQSINDKKTSTAFNVTPRFIVLSGGAGEERRLKVDGVDKEFASFWKGDPNIEPNSEVAIIGGGDGAFQDFLRATTIHKHPLDLIKAITAESLEIEKAIEDEYLALLSIENANKRLNQWGFHDQGSYLIAKKCTDVCCNLINGALGDKITNAVMKQIRNRNAGCIHLFSKSNSYSRCYLLNRFLVALIHAIQIKDKKLLKHIGFIQHGERIEEATTKDNKYILSLDTGPSAPYDNLIVRIGVDPDSAPGTQMVTLSETFKNSRVSLSNLLVPFSTP